jgi:AcrR family transcriptional regulator
MATTRDLLTKRRYSDISVATILADSGAAKGSFYFYFAGKDDLLAALVRDAVAGGLDAAQSWTDTPAATEPVQQLRNGAAAGARLWQQEAPVLRAIVEACGTNATLDELWRGQMELFTQAALARLDGDTEAAAWLDGRDPVPIVTSLTWLSERVYYLAATHTRPFSDEQVVIDVLADAWALALYGRRADNADPE